MKRDFTIGAAWSTAGGWIEQAVTAINFLVIARLVGVEAFGVAAMAFAFLFLGEFLVRDTLTESIVERRSLEDGRLEATFVALVDSIDGSAPAPGAGSVIANAERTCPRASGSR